MANDLRTTTGTTTDRSYGATGDLTPRRSTTARTLAIVGLVCAVVAVFPISPLLFGLAAVVLGVIARVQGDRLGTWTIVAGVVGIVVGTAVTMWLLDAIRDNGANTTPAS